MPGNMIHNISQNVQFLPMLTPASRTATMTSPWIDTLNFRAVTIAFHLGAHDRTTGDEQVILKIQEADDGAGTGVVDSTIATQTVTSLVPDATVGQIFLFNLDMQKHKRFVRIVGTESGTTPIDLCSAMALCTSGNNPPTQPATITNTND